MQRDAILGSIRTLTSELGFCSTLPKLRELSQTAMSLASRYFSHSCFVFYCLPTHVHTHTHTHNPSPIDIRSVLFCLSPDNTHTHTHTHTHTLPPSLIDVRSVLFCLSPCNTHKRVDPSSSSMLHSLGLSYTLCGSFPPARLLRPIRFVCIRNAYSTLSLPSMCFSHRMYSNNPI